MASNTKPYSGDWPRITPPGFRQSVNLPSWRKPSRRRSRSLFPHKKSFVLIFCHSKQASLPRSFSPTMRARDRFFLLSVHPFVPLLSFWSYILSVHKSTIISTPRQIYVICLMTWLVLLFTVWFTITFTFSILSHTGPNFPFFWREIKDETEPVGTFGDMR